MSFQSWLRQPSTITGVASLIGVAAGVIGHMLTGDTSIAAGAGVMAFAGTHLLVDDNTEAAAMQTLVTDGVNAAMTGHLRDNLPTLLKDAVAVATTTSVRIPAGGLSDAEMASIRSGMTRVVVPINQPPQMQPQPGGVIATTLGALVLASLALLTACAGTTNTQRAAAEQSAVDVLICLGQIAVPVDAEAQSGDSDAVKAARAARIAAATKACRDAAQEGAQALPGAAPPVAPAVPAVTPAPAVAADKAGQVG